LSRYGIVDEFEDVEKDEEIKKTKAKRLEEIK